MHLTETQLNDYVDDVLTHAEVAEVDAHLASCAACRGEAEALRGLVQRVGALPAAIEPERDLRAGIWAQADRRTLWHWRYPLAAAAILLIAISSTVTVLLTRNESAPIVRVTETTGGVDLVRLESQYSTEVQSLERTLREQRENLSPETVRILEENLAIIDKAIQEARTALVNDPQSDMLGELLRSAYQRKLDLLKQAARSSAET
jgi:hypothetical protein